MRSAQSRAVIFFSSLLFLGASDLKAVTLSDNLTRPSGGTELVGASTFFASSFGTGSYSSTLNTVSILADINAGAVPVLVLFIDNGGQPGTEVGLLAPSTPIGNSQQGISFGGNQLALNANSTYWIVAEAGSGSLAWSYANDEVGSGSGFQHAWAVSENGGADWFTSDTLPMQMSVEDSVIAIPEPGSLYLLFFAGLLGLLMLISRDLQRQRKPLASMKIVVICLFLFSITMASRTRAAETPLAYQYTQPAQTVLNGDGGPWDAADLPHRTVDQLKNIVVTFPALPGYSVGPLRLIHAPLCLNPVGASQAECGQAGTEPTVITDAELAMIDGYLQKAEDARLKVILRFAYNYFSGGNDAPMDIIVADIAKLSPIVAKHKAIIYAMDAGFIGYWGEGHNSSNGNNTPDKTHAFMEGEERYFGPYVMLMNRYPSNIMDWEPRGKVIWGIHDDHYAEDSTDSHTWKSANWARFDYSFNTLQHFGEGRTDQMPMSVEVGGENPTLQTYENFDAYSRQFHLNGMSLSWNTTDLSKNGHFPEIVNRVGPVIGLTSASLDSQPLRGSSSALTLSFINTGYSRLFVKVPVYVVLTDSAGQRMQQFAPVPVPIDLTSIMAYGGRASASAEITFPADLPLNQAYNLALWMPDPDLTLATYHEYNYLLNNENVPDAAAGLNRLFPISVS